MKIPIKWFCGIFILAGSVAQAQFTYTTNGSDITLTSYDGSGDMVAIADFVTSIGSGVFNFDTDLTNVMIPEGVTSIEGAAFLDCISISNIVIPDSVTNIANSAFQSSGLTNVMIPASVIHIGANVFYGCLGMASITVDPQNLYYSSSNGVLFDVTQSTLIEYPDGLSGSYTIPGTVTNIGSFAFGSCPNLSGITIPSSVISIGMAAFVGCQRLTNITIPASVVSIGVNAFVDCSALTNITIPASVNSIGDSAFFGCISLTNVYFTGNAPVEDGTAFEGDTNTTVYFLPGTTGWSSPFGEAPALLWNPAVETIGGGFGVETNRFGFTITGTTNIAVQVEACTNLASPVWLVITNVNLTNGTFYFSDPHSTNYRSRFYRIIGP